MAWSYEEALSFLDDHVNLEAGDAGRAQPTLDRIRQAMTLMGEPQTVCPVVHITGTNGKGSTARMISSILATLGLSVGTYTSPDLQRVNERLAWNGEAIDDDAFAEVVEAVAGLEPLLDDRLSRFEILTAAAYRWFADVAVDAAVVEVGMGGRWDATNVADARVAVVTNVTLDHAEILGPSLGAIAGEKAGIVKPGSTLVLGETDPALASVFRAAGAEEVWERERDFATTANRVAHGGRLVSLRTPGAAYDEVFLPVHGAHQGDNAAVALAAAEAFFSAPIPEDAVSEAFAGLRLPGRMEVMGRHPLVVLDGAHNVAGARAAAATLAEEFTSSTARVMVAGMLRGRDPRHLLEPLLAGGADLLVACPAPSPRSMPAEEVADAARSLGVQATAEASVPAALEAALQAAGPEHLVFVTGSLYVVGAARSVLAGPAAEMGGNRSRS